MLVFGGNIEGSGPCSDLWDLVLSKSIHAQRQELSQDQALYFWKTLEISGPRPPPRTLHASGMIVSGELARMVVVGGTSASMGTGQGAMLCDAWVLNLNKRYCTNPTWLKLDWSGEGVSRCRNSMVVMDATSVVLHCGYNGEIVFNDCHCMWRGELKTKDNKHLDKKQRAQVSNQVDANWLQDRWEAEIPVCIEDLSFDKLEKAKYSNFLVQSTKHSINMQWILTVTLILTLQVGILFSAKFN